MDIKSNPLYQNAQMLSRVDANQSNSKRDNPELWKVSKGFESMFMAEMVKAMRKTIPQTELTKPSMGRQVFTEFLDLEYSKMAAGNSTQSLTAMVYRYLVENNANPSTPIPDLNMFPSMGTNPPPHVQPYKRQLGSISEEELSPLVKEAALHFGIDENLVKSVIRQESANKPNALSKAGAKGLMQLMDTTAKEMGVNNVYDPRENIMGGVRYLKYLQNRYEGDEQRMLAAYNAGPGAVDKYNGIPPYPETQHYVKAVLSFKEALDKPKQGDFHDH